MFFFFVTSIFSDFLPDMLVLLEWITKVTTNQPTNHAVGWLQNLNRSFKSFFMGLPVALTSHGDDDLLFQDSVEVWEMLTAPAISSLLLFSTPWGPKKPLSQIPG